MAILYKITSGLFFNIGIFIKAAAEDKHRVQKDNAQSQRNHNKDCPALIALKIYLRHAGNNCSGSCLFSLYGNSVLLYISDSLDRGHTGSFLYRLSGADINRKPGEQDRTCNNPQIWECADLNVSS